ncbi:MAG: hypothetical protein QM703_04130 [Gemmatales bacterium]
MRQLICLWFAALSLLFILHASMAVEPAAGLPEMPTGDKDGQAQSTDSLRSPGEVMLDTRLKLVEQGLAKYAPAIQPQEALLLLSAIKTRIESLQTAPSVMRHLTTTHRKPWTTSRACSGPCMCWTIS